ncbi:MAG: CPBP family intramembrane metalloprotease [Sphingobacterium sp.]|nr:CPBP family intramembrane metalloprotease [Sphingobacterium sp.]
MNSTFYMQSYLRGFWKNYINFNWKFGLFLILMICVPRFILVLQANQNADYRFIGAIMVLSFIIPFVFLSRLGLKAIGLNRPKNFSWLVAAFLVGSIYAYLLFLLGETLYQASYQNWYVYIGQSYNIPNSITVEAKKQMFLIMAGTGMLFSPFGEELYYRGIVHESFVPRFGNRGASIIDSLAFALTHIAHFGLVYVQGDWHFLFVPALIWFLSMYFVSRLFYFFKIKSGAIWGAISCHAAFNLSMIYCIFYQL